MTDRMQIFFLDFGLSNMKHGVLQGRILSCDSDGKGLTTVLEGIRNMPGMTGLASSKTTSTTPPWAYTAMGNPKEDNGAIYRVDIDGHDNRAIVPKGSTFTPKQLQVVWEHRKLYWCDREGMRLFRANLDGSEIEVLVTTGTSEDHRSDSRNWCVGIAVGPVRRLMYWTQKGPSKGNEGRLFCTGLDIPAGEDCKSRSDIKLLLDRLPEPIDLDLDPTDNTLYLTDRGDPPFGNSINRIKLGKDGASVAHKKILVRKLHEAIGLALDVKHRMMYFTDLNGSLYKSRMDGSEEVTLFSEIGDLTGVACLSMA